MLRCIFRKQAIFTERKIYPYVQMEDLCLDLLPKLRKMAVNNHNGQKQYCKYYSGRKPEFDEGDVFKIVVPLNDQYEPAKKIRT